MIYLLIDTCIWKQLVSKNQVNPDLLQIEYWVNNENVKVLCPDVLRKEWEKHRVKEAGSISKAVERQKKSIKLLAENSVDIIDQFDIEKGKNILMSQIEIIDKILFNSCISFNSSTEVKAKVIDHKQAEKAPFHNRKDSVDDALLIFSSLEYITEQETKELYFISGNKNEFGSPSNIEREIHADIIEDFNGLHVEYFTRTNVAILYLITEKSLPVLQTEDEDKPAGKDQPIEIDKSKPILDQIHEYISLRFNEVNNVPNHILTRSYPFKKEDSFFPYYSTFSLSTDNEELFEFFGSIKIAKDGNLEFSETKFINGVDEYEKKTKGVLKRLSSNLIFNLESKKSHKRINIRFPENKKCNCIKCKYNRFQFGEAFKDLIAKPKEIGDLLRLAYVQYQVGNFIDESKLLFQIAGKAKKQDKKTTQFITEYNLSKLSVFIRNYYWGENSQDELVKKLKGINLDNQFAKLKTSENEKLLVWIKNSSFYSEANDRIHKTVSKIRDHYYSQLKGDWSSNNQVWELINEFAEIDAFRNSNFIIYDAFSEFREMTEAFIEGLFASHAISEPHNSRLSSFDDWLIQKILYYGKADTIIKYFGRYNLKGLVYKPTSKKGDTFLELIDNFLSGYSETIKAFKEHCEKDNRYFWDKYNTFFSNILVLAGLCKLEKKQVDLIAKKLLYFLKKEKSIYPYNIKYVRFFINKKGNELNKSTLKSFLIFAINNGKYHSEDFFEAVANQIKKHGCIKLTDKQFEKIERISFQKCSKCKHTHSPILIVYIHQIIEDNTVREKIKLAIENSLSKSYNADLYYFAAIYEILGVDGNFFTQLVNASVPNPKHVSFRKAFSGEDDNRHPRINMLINLCYKYNVDLSSSQFDQFRKIDVYYDWLLDLENFNYDEFDPKWVSEYPTKYYFEKIKQITNIKDKISEYLKYNIEPQLERDYINIFCIEK